MNQLQPLYSGPVAPDGRLLPQRPIPTRDQLRQLAQVLMQGETLDIDAMTHHHFAHGVYGREMRIPAGVIVVGKIHRYSTLNVLAQGSMSVTTPEGQKVIHAPAIFTSPPGMQKAALTLTDCVFLNVHPSFETDLEKLEAEFIVPDPLLTADCPALDNEDKECLGES